MTLRRKKNQTKHDSPEHSHGKGGGSVPSPSSRLLKHLLNPSVLTATVIIVLGFVCYSNTFDAQFYFDDQKSIVDNPSIRNLGNIKAIWKFSPIRFITYLSFAINYHFNQLHVFGYHLVNIIIHIITSFLVYLFVFYLSILTNKTNTLLGCSICRIDIPLPSHSDASRDLYRPKDGISGNAFLHAFTYLLCQSKIAV